MEKLNKKLNWAIGLSIAAIVLSGVMFILWCCKAGGFSTVNLDTFVGVIVALLAIIVTLVLGWQIFNIFEMRHKLEEMNELKSQFNLQSELIEELKTKTEHRVFLTWGEEAMNNKKYGTAIYYFIISLSHSLQLSKPINIKKLLKEMEFCNCKMVDKCPMNQEEYEILLSINETIKSTAIYSVIKKEYAAVYNSYIQKVEQKQE